jgi:hypothetical protein
MVEENPEWAQHGKENEGRAIAAYEYRYEAEVAHNLMLISDQYDWLSCSPDMMHLPDYNEGAEIKCRALSKNYRHYVRLASNNRGTVKACPAENRHQVQGAMWITGLPRWYFVNFYIGDDLEGREIQAIDRVAIPRDDKLIEQMEVRSLEFMTEVYREAGLA